MSDQAPHHRISGWLLVRGLPRDPHASPHIMAMLVSAVATVLLTRGFLAAAGYPQIGGRGLHVAHVLWGGLFMVVGLVLLLSFAGPVIRPVAAVVSGVGVGLFIDEVGKFVTSDNDYFYRPAAALMYVFVACLVLVAHLVHGRRAHHPSEHLAAAVDQAVAGVVGGFTPRRRAEAYVASTLLCAVFVAVGMLRLRRSTTAAYRWFYRALLVNLLFTRVFEFDVEQFLATFSVVVDVVMLAVVTAALTLRGPPVVDVGAGSRLVSDAGAAVKSP